MRSETDAAAGTQPMAADPVARPWWSLLDRELYLCAAAVSAGVLLAFYPATMLLITAFRDYLHWPSAVQAVYRGIEFYFPGDLIDAIRRYVPAGGRVQLACLVLLGCVALLALRPLGIGLGRRAQTGRRFVTELRFWIVTGASASLALISLFLSSFDRNLALHWGTRINPILPTLVAPTFTIASVIVLYGFLGSAPSWREAARIAVPAGLALEGLKLANTLAATSIRVPLAFALGPFCDFAMILGWSFAAAFSLFAIVRMERALHVRPSVAVVILLGILAGIGGAHMHAATESKAKREPAPATAPQVLAYNPTVFAPVFASDIRPVLRIHPGDTIRTITLDNGGNDAALVQHAQPLNPQTGPFYIEGAQPGDTLVVHFSRLRLNRNQAGSAGALIPNAVTADYLDGVTYGTDALEEWTLDRQAGFAALRNPTPKLTKFRVPLRPMLGCIAVAPPGRQRWATNTLGSWGGNLDYSGIEEGATVYLPVYHPGALLFVGDGHAREGDGEIADSALETSLDLEFTVEVRPEEKLDGPRVESASSLMVMGVDESLEKAIRKATTGLVRWIEAEYRLSPSESAAVLSHALHYDVAEIANPQADVVARIEKSTLATLR